MPRIFRVHGAPPCPSPVTSPAALAAASQAALVMAGVIESARRYPLTTNSKAGSHVAHNHDARLPFSRRLQPPAFI